MVASPALPGFYRLVLSGLGFVFSGRLPVRLFAWTLALFARVIAVHLTGTLVVLAVFPAGTRIVGSLLESAIFGVIVGKLICPAVLRTIGRILVVFAIFRAVSCSIIDLAVLRAVS